MSVGLTIELSQSGFQELPESFDPDHERLSYGVIMPRIYERLDALAEQEGVERISTFFDDSDMLSPEEREEVGLPPAEAKWFPAARGLRTVKALIAALKRENAGEGELWDLEVSEYILSRAAEAGEEFRFYLS